MKRFTNGSAFLIIFFVLSMFGGLAASCGGSESVASGEVCELSCPAGMVGVERCPAFEECEVVEGCGEELVCAPEGAVNADNEGDQDGDGEGWSCVQSPQCPPGSEEVVSCPEDGVCTLVNMCEVSLTCLELPDACAQEPLCPDGDRGVTDRECGDDEAGCYPHFHCSGPLVCLDCDELATGCPEGQEAVAMEECVDDEGELSGECAPVETCEETLYCRESCVDEARACPGPTEEVDQCGAESTGCVAMEDQCGEAYFCGLVGEDGDDCRAIPVCEEGAVEVEVGLCVLDPGCKLVGLCNQLIGCAAAE